MVSSFSAYKHLVKAYLNVSILLQLQCEELGFAQRAKERSDSPAPLPGTYLGLQQASLYHVTPRGHLTFLVRQPHPVGCTHHAVSCLLCLNYPLSLSYRLKHT